MEALSGDVKSNLKKIKNFIHKAKNKKCDIVVFPELCVSGYFLGDLWLDDYFALKLDNLNKKLKKYSKGIVVIYGNLVVDKNQKNKDGSIRKYNCACIFNNGSCVQRKNKNLDLLESAQVKTLLPNYRIFDDSRYFFSTLDLSLERGLSLSDLLQPFEVDIKNKKINIGLQVCEDLWFENYFYNSKPLNTAEVLIRNGADVIVNISASPWTYGKGNKRYQLLCKQKKRLGSLFKPFIYVNKVGAQNNGKNIIAFDGGSVAYDENLNQITNSLGMFEEGLVVCDLAKDNVFSDNKVSKIEQKFNCLICGLKHLNLIFKTEDLKYVIGLSGGIDSAVVLTLLSLIAKKENIIAINMPTKYNSEATKNSAKKIAEVLGIKLLTIPIGELSRLNKSILKNFDIKKLNKSSIDLNNENIMAKIRGTSILSNFAQRHNAILVNNGNKLEIALGYATLYGDINGAIAPIGDLTKVEVFELAEFLNEKIFKKEVIPKELLPNNLFQFDKDKIAPSAELKKDQVDPIKFGYHDSLIDLIYSYPRKNKKQIINWYNDGSLCSKLKLEKNIFDLYGLNNYETFLKDLDWFFNQISKNIFKRIQSPPIIITSQSSFGFDIRESQI